MTTIEYDKELLQSNQIKNAKQSLAVNLRLNEKLILRASIGQLRALWQYALRTGTIPYSNLSIDNEADEKSKKPSKVLEFPFAETLSIFNTTVLEDFLSVFESSFIPVSETADQAEIIPPKQLPVASMKSIVANPSRPAENIDSGATKNLIERLYDFVFDDEVRERTKYEENDNMYTPDGKLKVAILVASKVNREIQNAMDLPFINILLRSIIKLWHESDSEYFFTFYIGFDEGDLFYDSEENMKVLHDPLKKLSGKLPFAFRTICTGATHHAPARVWSIIASQAYEDG